MAKIKFTPFILFLILLVVLVISVLFGYKNKIFENATTRGPSYSEIAEINGRKISVDKSSGNILVKDVAGNSSTVIDSDGRERSSTDETSEKTVESAITMSESSDNSSAFLYEDGNVIIPYVKYEDDIYIMIIDPKGKKAISSYTYAKGKDKIDDSVNGVAMDFKNISADSQSKNSAGNIVSVSSDIDIDISKNKIKKDGNWKDIRTKNVNTQIIPSKDGSYVVSMEGTASTSNYVVFVLYMSDDIMNMDPVILKYDSSYSKKKKSKTDMSKYVPKTWLNPNGCPKCPNSGNCSTCGTPGSAPGSAPGSTSGSGTGSGSTAPGAAPGFGNNLVNQSAGVANRALDSATALGLGAGLGATVLGASAIGGATSIGNNAIGGAAGLGNNAIGGAAGLGNNAIGGATRLGQGVTNAAGQAVGAAGNVLNSTVGTAGGVVNNAVNKLTGLASGLGNNAADILKSGNRTIVGQNQAGQAGQASVGANGQIVQSIPGQSTPYGQMISYQPSGQQYAGYQFANPMFLPYSETRQQGSDFRPLNAAADLAGKSKGGNYVA